MGRLEKVTPRITRDLVLFMTGLAGICYETLVTGADRPTLLILFGGMVGLPVFLRTDEQQKPQPPDPGLPRPDDNSQGG